MAHREGRINKYKTCTSNDGVCILRDDLIGPPSHDQHWALDVTGTKKYIHKSIRYNMTSVKPWK